MSRRALTIVLSIAALTASAPTNNLDASGGVSITGVVATDSGHFDETRFADPEEKFVASMGMHHHHHGRLSKPIKPGMLGGYPGPPASSDLPHVGKRDQELTRDPFGGTVKSRPPTGGTDESNQPALDTIGNDLPIDGRPPLLSPDPQGGSPDIPSHGRKPEIGKRFVQEALPAGKDPHIPPRQPRGPVSDLDFTTLQHDSAYDEVVNNESVASLASNHVHHNLGDRKAKQLGGSPNIPPTVSHHGANNEIINPQGLPLPVGGHENFGSETGSGMEKRSVSNEGPSTWAQEREVNSEDNSETAELASADSKDPHHKGHVHHNDRPRAVNLPVAELPPAHHGVPTENGHLQHKRDHQLSKREYYPAKSWTKSWRPVISSSCKPALVTTGIQDTECYKNVRVHHVTHDNGLQSFATFKLDHNYEYINRSARDESR
ncbi:protein of unknown function [Taphrina deformans PYCC 5710]|uniref:Uncharacterized protein n=1 Tax=Taphrina deformans (strain PYCC 5710 / ATCC 11124 / CBS 356.35 / IMI 108563 / JCM 9778 / NBRC 8474) TaxID=1097556 RepID=R4XGP2_TAPDE|nr:protein of unknown function [Taphrina deformans PYCC 5710]|eukprot:CCG84966.1 protein of unknown function [Taphrina deformans PYCC 5710]